MADFFQALSTIGDTLVNNRTRSFRERTLADLGQHLGDDDVDYKALAAKLMAAGEVRGGLMALNLGLMRDGRLGRRGDAATDLDAAAAEASGAKAPTVSSETTAALLTNPSLQRQFDATYGPGASARLFRLR
jgi:hypothetical protein